ncbi:unnamed protein product [Owenia fusiformis]|uniref:Uncharacterized protein n=1 Tax=Owenia fusiformis TaxID=6347 RepID=A0A8J1UHP9_OWEFU|nr:unnamed protein product [Owenia fusiformis]
MAMARLVVIVAILGILSKHSDADCTGGDALSVYACTSAFYNSFGGNLTALLNCEFSCTDYESTVSCLNSLNSVECRQETPTLFNNYTIVNGMACEYEDLPEKCPNVAPVNDAPVTGGWGEWGNFSACTATCEAGISVRTRECNNPTPANGGANCTGNSTETVLCPGPDHCPIDGGLSNWTSQGCNRNDVTCSGGTETWTRTCDSPEPMYGGANCTGDTLKVTGCNGSDICLQSCTSDQITCDGGAKCLSFSQICNGFPDCADGFDESELACLSTNLLRDDAAMPATSFSKTIFLAITTLLLLLM